MKPATRTALIVASAAASSGFFHSVLTLAQPEKMLVVGLSTAAAMGLVIWFTRPKTNSPSEKNPT